MSIKPVLYSLVLLLVCMTGKSQVTGFTKTADKYFTAEEYSRLIKEAAIATATDQDIPESVFIENYHTYQSAVEGVSRLLIVKKFRWLEQGFSTKPAQGSEAFQKRKETYVRELQRGVRDALLSNEKIFSSIKSIDQTDRILSFNSDITVHNNGLIKVIETIMVYNGDGSTQSSNNEIQRGIRRSFPTRYSNRLGMISTVPFHLQNVLINGAPELYFTEKADNGIVLYVGRRDKILSPGVYTYQISYETDRQIIYHKDKDEVYWNVNGNGWSFSIEKTSCSIHFPDGVAWMQQDCYTGKQGDTEHACSGDSTKNNTVYFKSNRILQPYEGLTVSASINKGLLLQPPLPGRVFSFLKDNIILSVLMLTALLLFFFHFRAWRRVGKDPRQGVIIPQFEPPANMSPADAGFLLKQQYSAELFAASIIDHAVNHRVNIAIEKEGLILKTPVYYFNAPTELQRNVADDKKRYEWYGYDIETLYGEKAESGQYNSRIASMYNSLEEKLKERLLIRKGKKNTFKGLFSLNDHYAGIGVIVLIFLGIGTVIYLSIFYTKGLIIASIILFLLCVAIQAIFMKLMSAYTQEGRKAADHVSGFKMYLKTAEQHKFDMLNPPEKTIQLFEKFLPYAIALQCENAWANQFEPIIRQAAEKGHQPSYYHGIGGHSYSSSFSSGIASGLAGTIASASTPPSSSSGGSSGGGSSGGGGGGGGGGGW